MKTKHIFFTGLITALILSEVSNIIFNKYHSTDMLDEFQAELDADLKEQLLEAFEDDGELDKVNIEHELWVAIGNVGLWNVDFGFLDIAEQFANEYLQIAQKYKDDFEIVFDATCYKHNGTDRDPNFNQFGQNFVKGKVFLLCYCKIG